jgi:putative FmdB family regulatory protein
MPTYEYACKACGQHLEVVQSFKDNALSECPACGGRLRKVFGNIGIAFKGSGFYKTDSRAEVKKAGAKAGGEAKTTGPESAASGAASGSSGTPQAASAAASAPKAANG